MIPVIGLSLSPSQTFRLTLNAPSSAGAKVTLAAIQAGVG
jgi:hypothetical protein